MHFSKKDATEIIIDGNVSHLVSVAKPAGTKLKEEKLSTGQIRTIFGEVRQIEMKWPVFKADWTTA
ncbi:type III-A CRISPR-associated protein Csm2 [Chloroflexi bacterium TSY]|nr:type III-A CRISPR-associated protein Csm2 [Chloroflexi bacterium TSY]